MTKFVRSISHEIKREIESDPALKASIERTKEDISEGRVYSTEKALGMLERGKLE